MASVGKIGDRLLFEAERRPEWSEHFPAYALCKKRINELVAEVARLEESVSVFRSTPHPELLSAAVSHSVADEEPHSATQSDVTGPAAPISLTVPRTLIDADTASPHELAVLSDLELGVRRARRDDARRTATAEIRSLLLRQIATIQDFWSSQARELTEKLFAIQRRIMRLRSNSSKKLLSWPILKLKTECLELGVEIQDFIAYCSLSRDAMQRLVHKAAFKLGKEPHKLLPGITAMIYGDVVCTDPQGLEGSVSDAECEFTSARVPRELYERLLDLYGRHFFNLELASRVVDGQLTPEQLDILDDTRTVFPSLSGDAPLQSLDRVMLTEDNTDEATLIRTAYALARAELEQSVDASLAYSRNPLLRDITNFSSRARAQLPDGLDESLTAIGGPLRALGEQRRRFLEQTGPAFPQGRDHRKSISAESTSSSAETKKIGGKAAKPKRRHGLGRGQVTICAIAVVIILIFAFLPAGALGAGFASNPAAQRCLGLLIASALLWASGALPLHITSMLIPIIAVPLQVFRDGDTDAVLDASAASDAALAALMSGTLSLVLAGFTMSIAMRNTKVDIHMATWIMSRSGGRPRVFVLLLMCLTAVLSVVVSNVSGSQIALSLVLPLLRELSPDSRYSRTLLMAICVAGNLGGMTSPLASTQSAVTSEMSGMSFGTFMVASLPSVIVLLVLSWIILVYGPFKPDISAVPDMLSGEEDDARLRWTGPAKLTVVLMACSVVLWCALPLGLDDYIGESSIVSIIPTVSFLIAGQLSLEDFHARVPWNVLLLMMGGHVLGAAVESSALLEIVADSLATALPESISENAAVFVLCVFSAVVATFIPHTVSALVLLPIIKEVMGVMFPASATAAAVAVFTAGLVNSGASGLPVSSFPNVAATSVRNEHGAPYIKPTMLSSLQFPLTLLNLAVIFVLGGSITRLLLA
jgi:anion transporter